jgi:Tfp pilus assembly protein PilO
MKALFAYGSDVPVKRVLMEHRRWLTPVGIVLAINVAVLIALVLPLRQSVQSSDARAEASAVALGEAMADLADAEATRDGQSRAAVDLDRFYADILPSDFTTARRITHIKLTQLARSHDVVFESSSASPRLVRDSVLEQLEVKYALSGDWDDIRQFIYAIETGPDFVVIDNMQLGEGEANASLFLNLDLSTYYRIPGAPRPQSAGAPGPPAAQEPRGAGDR